MGRAVYEDDSDDSMQGGPEEGPATKGAGEIAEKGFVSEPTKPANFKDAFAAARKAGDKTFEFNGKKFTTELASSKPAAYAPSKPAASTSSKSETSTYRNLDKGLGNAMEKANAEDRHMQKLKAAGERAIIQQQGEKVVKDYRAKQARQKEANEYASMNGNKAGGKISSASRRGDGIATKGHTRGRYI